MTIAAMPSSSLFFFVIIIIMIISYDYATRKKITWCGTKWTNEKKTSCKWKNLMLLLNDDDKHPLMVCVCVWMQSLQNFSWRCHHRSHGFFAYALIIHSGRMVEICCCFFFHLSTIIHLFSLFFQYSNIYWQRHILITLMVFFHSKISIYLILNANLQTNK